MTAHSHYIPVREARGVRIEVSCHECGARISAPEAVADTSGKAFRAFYCHGCAERRDPEAWWANPELAQEGAWR